MNLLLLINTAIGTASAEVLLIDPTYGMSEAGKKAAIT